MVHTKRNLAHEKCFLSLVGNLFLHQNRLPPLTCLATDFLLQYLCSRFFSSENRNTADCSQLFTELGTEEQACFVGASEELTLGCCKKDKYQKILMSVTVLKAGRVPGGPPLCMLEEWRNTLHHRHKAGWAWTFLVERDGDSISAWELFPSGCPNQLVCFSAINRNYHLD